MVSRSPRLGLRSAAVVAVVLLAACQGGGPKKQAAAPTTAPPVTSASTASAAPPTTAPAVPPATEPPADVARLRPILLGVADLPAGFSEGRPGDTGDDLLALRPCGQPLTAATPSASVRQVLQRSLDQLRVVDQVDAYAAAGAASAPLVELRALGQRCHVDGSTAVTPLSPPAVGEDVAGLQLSGPSGVVAVAMVRSGPLVTVVVLAAPRPIAAATYHDVVQAAGIKLAVGTGG